MVRRCQALIANSCSAGKDTVMTSPHRCPPAARVSIPAPLLACAVLSPARRSGQWHASRRENQPRGAAGSDTATASGTGQQGQGKGTAAHAEGGRRDSTTGGHGRVSGAPDWLTCASLALSLPLVITVLLQACTPLALALAACACVSGRHRRRPVSSGSRCGARGCTPRSKAGACSGEPTQVSQPAEQSRAGGRGEFEAKGRAGWRKKGIHGGKLAPGGARERDGGEEVGAAVPGIVHPVLRTCFVSALC
jgi:hypothetical protein